MTIKVSIIGVTGYTGGELLRLLLPRDDVEISFITSRRHENTPIGELFPRLSHRNDILVTNTSPEEAASKSDVVFLCLPHETTQEVVPDILGKTKIIDLSADFRLNDTSAYAKYYSGEHKYPEMLAEGRFVYGLPEFFAEEIKKADAVANPGCYAQLLQLLLYPYKGHIENVNITAISGMSGAGRAPVDPALFPPANHDMYSYKINQHRHRPEIMQNIGLTEDQLDFVPTVGPFMRGIFATAFIKTDRAEPKDVYAGCPFIRIVDKVQIANIAGTNFVDLSFMHKEDSGVIVQGAFDNLLKGASGTAVQNMNLMFGLPETKDLDFSTPVYPS